MKKLFKVIGFVGMVVLLQVVINQLNKSAFKSQKQIIESKDIDPAVFFYTESEQALKAEKVIRKRITTRSEFFE